MCWIGANFSQVASALTECGPVTKNSGGHSGYCPSWTLSPWHACVVPTLLALPSPTSPEQGWVGEGTWHLPPLPPTDKKEGKRRRRKKIKARQDIAILQHPWQLLRLPGKSPSLCVLQAAAWSPLPKWDQAFHTRGEEPCDFTHEKVVAQLGVEAKS